MFYIEICDNASDLPIPSYMTDGAAGMDLYANIETPYIVQSKSFMMVPCGIKIAIPSGFEAQIRARSGLAAKHGIGVLNGPGTIDSDYRGEIKVILFNFSEEDFEIRRKDRIAQLVINRVETITWTISDRLPDTIRGNGAFGHTGMREINEN